MRPAPAATSAPREARRAARACTHAPAVQVKVAPLSASPATVADCPRNTVRNSGRRVSAPKNARLTSPIEAMAAGRPGRARSVPAGISRRRPGRTAAVPTASNAAAAGSARTCSARSTKALPAARRTANPIGSSRNPFIQWVFWRRSKTARFSHNRVSARRRAPLGDQEVDRHGLGLARPDPGVGRAGRTGAG